MHTVYLVLLLKYSQKGEKKITRSCDTPAVFNASVKGDYSRVLSWCLVPEQQCRILGRSTGVWWFKSLQVDCVQINVKHRVSCFILSNPSNPFNFLCLGGGGGGVESGVPQIKEDSDSGPYLSHLDFCVILLQSIWLLCNLFYNWNSICILLYTIVHKVF